MSSCILYNNTTKELDIVDDSLILDGIYFYKYSVPNHKQLITNNDNIKNIIKSHKDPIKFIKKYISKIKLKIPLYDIFNHNIFLINNTELYKNVIFNNFRFPDNNFLKLIKNNTFNIDYHFDKNINNVYLKNKNFIIYFLEQFDLDVLYKTYVEAFYENEEISKNISVCVRPSFIPHFNHITPYYTRNEIIKIALNNNIIDNENINIMDICDKIIHNDISSHILLEHHNYIIDNNYIGLMQYYTLQGSYFMNLYLRNTIFYINKTLENLIVNMTSLIHKSPKFNKPYILYRFVNSDTHLKNLKIGDLYIEHGFTSTTRNPFYNTDIYNFGNILIKIKVPDDKNGIALCLETLSLFPNEQEIILAPYSILKLDNIGNNVSYHHIDSDYEKKIQTKYEFTFIGYKNVTFVQSVNPREIEIIDFFKLKKLNNTSVNDKIDYFSNNLLNENYQFAVIINDTQFIINAEWYDSTNAYKHMYAVNQTKGFSLYCIYDNSILFFLELGNYDGNYMHINYFLKQTATPRTNLYTKIQFINFIVSIGYWFDIDKITFHTDYDISKSKRGGIYCLDFYEYFKFNKKLPDELNVSSYEFKPEFAYYNLDKLKTSFIKDIITPKDDILYQLYIKSFSDNNIEHTIDNFYIWLIENNCYLLSIFIDKIKVLFLSENPFLYDYYTMNTFAYLYNKNIIPDLHIHTDTTPYIINKYRTIHYTE